MRQHFPPIFPANFFLSLFKNALKVLALSLFRSLLRRIRSIVAMIGHQPIRVNFGNFLAIRHRLSSSVRNCDTTTRHHYCALRFRSNIAPLHSLHPTSPGRTWHSFPYWAYASPNGWSPRQRRSFPKINCQELEHILFISIFVHF